MVISFPLFDFSSFRLLVCLEKPLEIVIFKFSDVLMFEFFGNFDGFVPPVKLLIHSHSFFNLIILDQNSFSLVELLVKNG